jgi:hypothetical protein
MRNVSDAVPLLRVDAVGATFGIAADIGRTLIDVVLRILRAVFADKALTIHGDLLEDVVRNKPEGDDGRRQMQRALYDNGQHRRRSENIPSAFLRSWAIPNPKSNGSVGRKQSDGSFRTAATKLPMPEISVVRCFSLIAVL